VAGDECCLHLRWKKHLVLLLLMPLPLLLLYSQLYKTGISLYLSGFGPPKKCSTLPF
jgi:hypothetical protein